MQRHSRSRLRTEGRGIRIPFKSNLGWGKLPFFVLAVVCFSRFFLCDLSLFCFQVLRPVDASLPKCQIHAIFLGFISDIARVNFKAVNREDILSRRYRDRDLAKFESSRRYRER